MAVFRQRWCSRFASRDYALKNGHAVKQLLLLQFVASAVNSWTFGGVFDADLFVVSGGSNSFVGLVESVKGIAGLACAVPLGYLADVVPRIKFLRLLVVIGLPVSSIVILGLLGKQRVWLLAGAVAFAVFLQGFSGNLNALFADVTMPGKERALVMGWQGMVTQFGNCAGALMQMVLLLFTGSQEHWDPNLLGVCLTCGLSLLFFTVPLVFRLRDQPAEDDPESSATQELHQNGSVSSNSSPVERAADAVPEWAKRRLCGGGLEVRWLVVVLLEVSFVIGLFCTGMSVKYFPLFYKQDFGFSPAGICGLNAAFPFVVMILIPFCVRCSRYIGQVPGILVWTTLGTLFMALLAVCENTVLSVVIFLLRNAFMKSRDPLFQALLMDCLEERHRGKFGAVTSVRSATWAGSAFVGGLFLDHHNSSYRALFLLTSALLLIHLVTMVPLLCIVPVHSWNAELPHAPPSTSVDDTDTNTNQKSCAPLAEEVA